MWKFFCFYIYIFLFVCGQSFLFVVLIACCFGVEGLNADFIVFILEDEVSSGHQAGWMKN